MSEEKRLTLEEALKITPFGTYYQRRENIGWYLSSDEFFDYGTYGALMNALSGEWEHSVTISNTAIDETEKILGPKHEYKGDKVDWGNVYWEKHSDAIEEAIQNDIDDGTIEIYAIKRW